MTPSKDLSYSRAVNMAFRPEFDRLIRELEVYPWNEFGYLMAIRHARNLFLTSVAFAVLGNVGRFHPKYPKILGRVTIGIGSIGVGMSALMFKNRVDNYNKHAYPKLLE